MAQNRRMISGQVEIQNYTIYNVTSDLVEIWQRDRDGTVSVWSGNVGNVHAPNGQLIEETGVYSEIAYPVEGFLGTRVMAHKGKLVDVIRNDNREKKMKLQKIKLREMSKSTKNKIWNGSILAAFIAAAAVFIIMLQAEKRFWPSMRKSQSV